MTNGTKEKHRKQHEGPLSRLFQNFTIDVTFWALIGMLFMLVTLNNLLRYTWMIRYYS